VRDFLLNNTPEDRWCSSVGKSKGRYYQDELPGHHNGTFVDKSARIQSIGSYTVILNGLAKPSIVENLNCRRSTCFLPSTLISCLSNLVPWYFSDTVLPCATPIVCLSPLLGSSWEVDMTVSRYGEGGDAEVDGKSKLEVCERV
jgi:hypothetical protein